MKIRDLFVYKNGILDVNWDLIVTIPEFKRLQDTPQSNVWHKEGDVFKHTQ